MAGQLATPLGNVRIITGHEMWSDGSTGGALSKCRRVATVKSERPREDYEDKPSHHVTEHVEARYGILQHEIEITVAMLGGREKSDTATFAADNNRSFADGPIPSSARLALRPESRLSAMHGAGIHTSRTAVQPSDLPCVVCDLSLGLSDVAPVH